MAKPKSIQIDIPNPCSQKWEEMTPAEKGRFCAHCQKTVIDFTTWSDAALYNFLSARPAGICGRYLSTQLNRPIYIPFQPHNRLYQATIALGLTLLVAGAPAVHAQNRPPLVTQTVSGTQALPAGEEPGTLAGTILGKKREPLANAVIRAFKNAVLKKSTVTDYDGNFVISVLEPGTYEVTITHPDSDTIRMKCVISSGVTTRLYWRPAPPLDSHSEIPVMITGGPEDVTTSTPAIYDIAATTPHVYQRTRGTVVEVGGARNSGTDYLIDTVEPPAKHIKKSRK